jgi:hypothetical protein
VPIYNRLSLIAVFCLCFACSVYAQKLDLVKGVVFKKNTPTTISFVTITNLNHKMPDVQNDELGSFHIEAALGDTLLFKKSDYSPQYIVVQTYVSQSVYMQPVIQLNQVTIKDVSKKQEINDALNDYKKKGQYYSLNPSIGSVLTSPISGLYDLFGKAPAQARKFRQYTQQELERIEINKRYNKPLVKQITKMPDEDLDSFMLSFTPNIEDIRIWSDYDIIDYIKRSYAYFVKNKESLKVEKLY